MNTPATTLDGGAFTPRPAPAGQLYTVETYAFNFGGAWEAFVQADNGVDSSGWRRRPPALSTPKRLDPLLLTFMPTTSATWSRSSFVRPPPARRPTPWASPASACTRAPSARARSTRSAAAARSRRSRHPQLPAPTLPWTAPPQRRRRDQRADRPAARAHRRGGQRVSPDARWLVDPDLYRATDDPDEVLELRRLRVRTDRHHRQHPAHPERQVRRSIIFGGPTFYTSSTASPARSSRGRASAPGKPPGASAPSPSRRDFRSRGP